MARTGCSVLDWCVWFAFAGLCTTIVAGGEPSDPLRNQLRVQAALSKGEDLLRSGDFAGAVAVLDPCLAHIDGNPRYLAALRAAYAGYVPELERTGKHDLAKKYRGYLEILGPASRGSATPSPAPMVAEAKPPATPPPATPPPGLTPRGKIEDDPFAATNSAERQWKSWLERATIAFEGKRYEDAATCYAKAEELHPGATADCAERYGYARLFGVAKALNAGGPVDPAKLEREIRAVVRDVPRLKSFGDGLLDRLKTPAESDSEVAAVEIKHTPREGAGWAVAETASIRMYHVLDKDQADKLIRTAEATRVRMTRKWFNEEATVWSPRCDIFIHPSAEGYAKHSGAPAASPGHSSILLEGGRITKRRIDLRGDHPTMAVGVLPHETTHVVLAGRFGSHHVPRWADEGIAVLSEPEDRVEAHLKNLPNHRRDGVMFGAGELMQQNDYPEPRRVGAFYAQSVSMVRYLAKKKDPVTFTRFLRAGLDGGWQPALEKHYGYRHFSELEADWREGAPGGEVAVSEKRTKR